MKRRAARCSFFLFFLLVPAAVIAAPADEPRPQRDVHAVRAAKPPVIDGLLDDDAWATAPSVGDFIQRDPAEGRPATQRTTVRVVYDEDAIYVGARMDDDAAVTSRLARRDSTPESDWFRVYLDTQFDRRSGAAFGVNPANVQVDMILHHDTSTDSSWDGVWESATAIDAAGWSAEFRIPYSQLRFPRLKEHVWGVNFIRHISSNKEEDRLVHTPKTEAGFVSRFARLVGLSAIEPKRALEITPYAVARADMSTRVSSDDPLNSSFERGADFGVDLKYTLTSSLTLTGTLNPDFGQVELDPATLNLTEFELFFPEKRPFFVEGSNLFTFGRGGSTNNFGFAFSAPQFFYSRRIGRAPQGMGRLEYDYVDAPYETTILAAAKLTGKTAGGWTIAAMDAVTEEERAEIKVGLGAVEGRVVEPMTNYFVSRLAKDLGTRGRIGTLFTATHRDVEGDLSFLRDAAYLGGIDGYWGFGDRDVILEWLLAGSRVEGTPEAIALTQRAPAHYFDRPDAGHVSLDPDRRSLDGWGGRVMLARQTGRWKYNLQAQSYSPGFETNDLGFIGRADMMATHAVLLYRNQDVKGTVRDRNFWLAKYQNWNFDGDLIANGIYGNGHVEFTNDHYVFVSGGPTFERLDDRDARGGPLVARAAGIDVSAGYGFGGRGRLFYEISGGTWSADDGGSGTSLDGMIGFRPSSNVTLELTPSFYSDHTFAQYVRTVRADATATHTYGNRYVYADLDQKTAEMGMRVDWTLSSRLSLQAYVQPFIASGRYYRFKELEAPRSRDFAAYGVDRGTIEQAGPITIDPDGDGPARAFTFSRPDFNLRSLRGSAVLRWEFRPGSTLFVVWNENRDDVEPVGDFRPRRDVSRLFDGDSDDVVLVKLSYWLPL
ncbi:MAG TPA: DUF5916 domain-containing protein [Thermoanaerobaculia bacterium]|nr:DUF5916 domain-containing protein [Thermoanaerobaculia bacterium]